MSEEHPAPAPAEPVPAAPPVPEPIAPPVSVPAPTPPEPAPAPAPEPPPEAAAERPAPGFLTEEPKPGEEAKPAEAPAESVPVEYEFVLPEGVALDPERAAPLNRWLGEHKIPQEKAQELVDMHLSAMDAFAKYTVEEQWRTFEELRITKKNEAMADPVFGGAGFRTNVTATTRIMTFLMPDAAERSELFRRLDASGMSDDVYLARMLLNAARRFAEPAPPPPNPAPLPPRDAAGRAPRGQGRGSLYTYSRRGGREAT